jgi:hypothetical protein
MDEEWPIRGSGAALSDRWSANRQLLFADGRFSAKTQIGNRSYEYAVTQWAIFEVAHYPIPDRP